MAPPKAIDTKMARLKSIMEDFKITQEAYEANKEEITIEQLQIYFEEAQTFMNQFNETYIEFCTLNKDDEAGEQKQTYINYKKEIHAVVFEIKLALMSNGGLANNPTKSSSSSMRKIKMPEIKLPEFDGSFEKWIHFRDTFKSLVHNNASFATIDKFHYLKAAIKIEPPSQNIVNNYSFSEENYESAWKAICDRYDDKRSLLLQHAAALFQVKKASDDTPTEIRRVMDSYISHRSAFRQMNITSEELNDLIFEQFIRYRIDDKTLRDWDLYVQTHDASWEELCTFLENRCKSLAFSIKKSNSSSKQTTTTTTNVNTKSYSKGKVLISNDQVKSATCKVCGENHQVFMCPSFLKESIDKRNEIVMTQKLCRNCLRPGHIVRECNNTKLCKLCGMKHHSCLHRNKEDANQLKSSSSEKVEVNSNVVQQSPGKSLVSSINESHSFVSASQTLLSTIKVSIQDGHGNWQLVRAILDSGSDENIITQGAASRLQLPLNVINKTVFGVNNSTTQVRHETTAVIKSNYAKHRDYINNFRLKVFPAITGKLPSVFVDTNRFQLPSKYSLADPEFNIPSEVEILIGVRGFWDSMLMEKHTLQNNAVMIHTKYGWILGGEISFIDEVGNSLISTCGHTYHSMLSLDDKVEKFWTLEQCESKTKLLTKEEKICEEIFSKTTKRDENGRYVVDLPLKDNFKQLGNNYNNAVQRFKYLESKFSRNPQFFEQYKSFIKEYEELGHMREIKNVNTSLNSCYYLPHHGVIKDDSTTTKLRVVFDASCKSQTGLSLNDVLNVGPVVQPELYDTVIKFMAKSIAIKADITKMYRQINVNEAHQPYQRMVWRDNPADDFKHYQLITVTYGTSAAPYLATRTLVQLAEDCEKDYPEASQLIKSSFYVDDLIFTCESLEEAIKLRIQLCNIFEGAGMSLRKWVSNEPSFFESIPVNERDQIADTHEIKALGILWNISSDTFSFKLKVITVEKNTMSSVLSQIASIYDPIGWLGPIILTAKLFMKKLWSRQLKWNSKLPEDLAEEWNDYKQSLSSISNIKIQRQIMCTNPVVIQLHGFSDASTNGYGMVIYARTIDMYGAIYCQIITAKSRVAPKKQITLARLELCGLLLLSKFIKRVGETLRVPRSDTYLWCDSLIALHWIQAEPAKLSVFVGNRVAEIQEHTEGCKFRHIRTNFNPADIISRGSSAVELEKSEMWWHGPSFLMLSQEDWPASMLEIDTNEEECAKEYRKVLTAIQEHSETNYLVDYVNCQFSSAKKLVKIFAFILNGLNQWKAKANVGNSVTLDKIQYFELAEKKVIQILQSHVFNQEFKALTKGQQVSKSSVIKQLHPFIDKDNIIRTSGRIGKCTTVSYDTKHQIILPKCKFVYNLVKEIHEENCHSTKLSTLAFVRQKYWPIHAKTIISKVVYQCVKCFRANPKDCAQLMGELPADRVNACYPFSKVSIDYAGPVNIKATGLRSSAIVKAYIALFKCLTTKSIHLELVSDLSTAAFIATLDRFISRRGLPTKIYSDNATCFEGADNHFKKLALEMQPVLKEYYNNKQIEWHFITPRAPHMGGLWEIGIKQAKYHLKRILTEKTLTFEELTTVLCRIEAILNSRPITAISDNPDDTTALTPGHFLIGRPLNSKLEKNVDHITSNRLNRWEVIQQIQQKFWKQWYDDIINNQTRPKGFQVEVNYSLNDLVLIKDANIPTMKWKLGRIIKLFPGKDEIVRNVRVKTSTGEIERHVRYLCKLPTEAEETFIPEAGEC